MSGIYLCVLPGRNQKTNDMGVYRKAKAESLKTRNFDNPEYVDDDEGYKFDEFGFIGFDAWQVNGGTIFDDIIITDNKAEVDDFAKK